ncbi:MAG: response regulator [Treponema sp.]|nr:response regulator [Treponema sp.]
MERVDRDIEKTLSALKNLYSTLNSDSSNCVYELDVTNDNVSVVSIEKNELVVKPSKLKGVEQWILQSSNNISSDFFELLRKKWKYLVDKASTETVVNFGSFMVNKLDKLGKNFWVDAAAVKVVKEENVFIYFLLSSSKKSLETFEESEVKDSFEDKIGYYKDFVHAASEGIYTEILRINRSNTEVFRVIVGPGYIKEIPLHKSWNLYSNEMLAHVAANDFEKYKRICDIDNLIAEREINRTGLVYRSNFYSNNSEYRWYFTVFRIYKDYIFSFTVDQAYQLDNAKTIKKDLVSASQYKKALLSDAVSVYEFNLTKDKLVGTPVQKMGDKIVSSRDYYNISEDYSYSDFIDLMAKDITDEKGKEIFLKNSDIYFLMDSFITEKFSTWFDIIQKDFEGRKFCFRYTTLLTNDEFTNDVLGITVVKNITTSFSHEEEQSYQMEVINALSMDYSNVYMVNLFTSKVRVVRRDDYVGAFYSDEFGEQRYEDALDFYVSLSVYEGDRDMMRMALSRENLMKQYNERDSFFVSFRSYINSKLSYMKLKIIKLGNESESGNILLGFMNVDEETEHEMKQRKTLQDALVMAESATKAKSNFLSNMSHDIRTPMNAIVGFTELAQRHVNDVEKVNSYLEKIRSSSKHLLGLINDVLDMSRIESGKMKIQTNITSLERVIQDVDNVVQPQIQAKKINYTIERHGDLQKLVHCDNLRLNQVLINILGNAVKYTPENGMIKFTVSEMPQIAEGYVSYQFRIKDNGIGMSQEFQEKLFDPFERDENNSNYQIQGTGLGLAITKNIVDLMNGSIFVKSEIDQGSEFLVCFDFESAEEAKFVEQEKKKQAPVDLNKFKGVRILLVEDNELNRDIARELLKQVGFVLDEAVNGKLGADRYAASEPGYYKCILMDVQMPVMNGYEATKTIREFEQKIDDGRRVPIVAMTANAFNEDKKEALESGMNAFVSKPFDINELLRVLDEMISLNVK